MILKVEDVLKSLRRTPACRSGRDPDCKARRDQIGLYSSPLAVYGERTLEIQGLSQKYMTISF